ncbi:SDR family NAD(P)-dependent oxidoreductase [Balneatrix alpica]|uniref:SDR family NAD(P)-dependent oxidoreductase n=1 Tax=Balneatrix alpica TaxID=75684 RepID=UPI00273A5551|nr:SDR family oxidoreductase [Balneatrix alpica]
MKDSVKHFAITGGNSGIGLAIAKLYLQEGHRVSVLSRHFSQPNTLQLEYPEQYYCFSGNVASVNDIEQFYQHCTDQLGRLDGVVANAGVAIAEAIEDVTEESFQNTFDINVKGVFFTVQKALPYLNPHAAITLISSIQSGRGAGVWAAYGATKAAVRSLTRSFAAELGGKNIRVNCVSPGVTDTPILGKFGFDNTTLNNILEQVKSATPLERLGQPEEIARTVAFINSEAASFITGVDLQVDGGLAQI